MPQVQGFHPTLLVGVGGTGSKIAQNVYDRAMRSGAAAKGRLKVLAFDTDENDTRRLDRLDRTQRVRFSTANTVEEILDLNPEIERKWFVPRRELPTELRTMTALHGAGQVRMLSRLALHHAAANGDIERHIGAALSDLAAYDRTAGFTGLVNVLFVGSLAGATGSGSFLQLALLVRDIALARNLEVDQHGLFLMPDIYVRSGVLPEGQIPSVLANGYASFKEFHAITLKATDRAGDFDFEFEYAPGRYLEHGFIPFRSITIIDFEDGEGGNLGRSVTPYLKQAERAAYTLLFTPIGGRFNSIAVNDLREQIEAAARGTHNRISGIGVSALVYPKEDMADYLARRFARELLAADWLRLDNMYRDRVRRYQQQKAAGHMQAKEPELGKSYLEDLRQLAQSDQVPFFREIYDELYPKEEDEQGYVHERPLHESYFGAFKEYVEREFWSRPDLEMVRKAQRVDETRFSKQTLVDDVRRHERILDNDLAVVDEALMSVPDDIVIGMFTTADSMGEQEWKPHHMQYWLVREGPHPVRSRAFLFALRELVEKERAELNAEEKREQLFRLANRFRTDEERAGEIDRRGTANVLELASQYSNRGVFSKLLKRGDDFIEEYVSYYNASRRKIEEYATARLMEKAFDRLLQQVDDQIRVMNGFFAEIETSLERLEKDIEELETRHEREREENVIYVCADARCKQALWEEVRERMAGQRLGKDINTTLMKAVYDMGRHNSIHGRPKPLRELSELLEREVIGNFAAARMRDDFASVHEMSVVQAMRRQAEIMGRDEDLSEEQLRERTRELIQNLIDVAHRQSSAMITTTSRNDGQEIRFWALGENLVRELDEIDDHRRLLNPSGQGVQILPHEEFPDNEIMGVNLRVNLEVTHLAKLRPPAEQGDSIAGDRAGRYFQEYSKMVDELVEAAMEKRIPATITPHIHRDWHKPGLLPEISSQVTERLVMDVNRALNVAMALEALQSVPDYGQEIYKVDTMGRVRQGGVSVELGSFGDFHEVMQAFMRHPEAIRGSLLLWEEELARLRHAPTEEVLAFEERVTDPAHLARGLAVLTTDPEDSRRQGRVAAFVAGQAQILFEFLNVTRRELPLDVRRRECDELASKVGEEALQRLEQHGVRAEHLHVMRAQQARGLERWRAFGRPELATA